MMTEWVTGLMKGWMRTEMKNIAFSANILLGPIETIGHDLTHLQQRKLSVGETTGRGHESLAHSMCSGYSL